MQTIKVKLVNIGPLLMHALPQESESKIRDTGKEFNPEEEAEKGLYKDKNGKIYFPSKWIKGCLEGASKGVKKGMVNLRSKVLQAVSIYPPQIYPIKLSNYEIDKQYVRLQGRNLILRSRPRFDEWEIDFEINFDEEIINKEDIMKLLTRAGKFIGIRDGRKLGYGRFTIEKFEVEK
ncbi:MAG: hypothetical protein QME57_01225 [Patescibacteria group bacterium]|nr:hypothetical protein [Patescibacteria group bacterium]